ncbi:DUF1761 domain-containing protein [Sedimentitalea todarodis]|uniref:DUF1761 domain-containing protein n=1 Tax=Sedimentitalea todarodis TaxID=1631240 RepID=A0ABU3VG64_9RHOB|nr:DUF1761 domain-containing protein [Sedimentitalea todarodis]MDU9005150.1 DUF1761 domain-containing protein [Sedimentitalea todarodis]
MEFLSVIAAAATSFVLGAVWYMALAEPWMQAAGIRRDADGGPEGGQSPVIFAMTFVLQLVVAGMMRHVFSLGGIDTLGAGLVAGGGVGLFFITPWIAINNAYGMRPVSLTVIDGGYATLGCAAMGLVLALF